MYGISLFYPLLPNIARAQNAYLKVVEPASLLFCDETKFSHMDGVLL